MDKSNYGKEHVKERIKERSKVRIRIPAHKVKERTRGAVEIAEYVNEAIALIEEDIENAIENQQSMAITEINTSFDIPCMSNRDAQRDIYFLIGQALIKAGYFPLIEYIGEKSEDQRVFVYTRWNTEKDVEVNDYKDQFLKQITVKTKKSDPMSSYMQKIMENSSTKQKRQPKPRID